MLVEDHLRPAAVKAGVLKEGEKVRFGFHNLRHSLASFLVRKGTDVKTVQKLLRHSDVATRNLCSQHERGSFGSSGRNAGGDDDAVKRGELSYKRCETQVSETDRLLQHSAVTAPNFRDCYLLSLADQFRMTDMGAVSPCLTCVSIRNRCPSRLTS